MASPHVRHFCPCGFCAAPALSQLKIMSPRIVGHINFSFDGNLRMTDGIPDKKNFVWLRLFARTKKEKYIGQACLELNQFHLGSRTTAQLVAGQNFNLAFDMWVEDVSHRSPQQPKQQLLDEIICIPHLVPQQQSPLVNDLHQQMMLWDANNPRPPETDRQAMCEWLRGHNSVRSIYKRGLQKVMGRFSRGDSKTRPSCGALVHAVWFTGRRGTSAC